MKYRVIFADPEHLNGNEWQTHGLAVFSIGFWSESIE
jgi:hypothetical protein